jgi:hypothetical protein
MSRTIDRRAEWYLRQIDALTNPVKASVPPRPRWHIILECVAIWLNVALAVGWLAHRWGWIA